MIINQYYVIAFREALRQIHTKRFPLTAPFGGRTLKSLDPDKKKESFKKKTSATPMM
jgi:hypothetical protein